MYKEQLVFGDTYNSFYQLVKCSNFTYIILWSQSKFSILQELFFDFPCNKHFSIKTIEQFFTKNTTCTYFVTQKITDCLE